MRSTACASERERCDLTRQTEDDHGTNLHHDAAKAIELSLMPPGEQVGSRTEAFHPVFSAGWATWSRTVCLCWSCVNETVRKLSVSRVTWYEIFCVDCPSD